MMMLDDDGDDDGDDLCVSGWTRLARRHGWWWWLWWWCTWWSVQVNGWTGSARSTRTSTGAKKWQTKWNKKTERKNKVRKGKKKELTQTNSGLGENGNWGSRWEKTNIIWIWIENRMITGGEEEEDAKARLWRCSWGSALHRRRHHRKTDPMVLVKSSKADLDYKLLWIH